MLFCIPINSYYGKYPIHRNKVRASISTKFNIIHRNCEWNGLKLQIIIKSHNIVHPMIRHKTSTHRSIYISIYIWRNLCKSIYIDVTGSLLLRLISQCRRAETKVVKKSNEYKNGKNGKNENKNKIENFWKWWQMLSDKRSVILALIMIMSNNLETLLFPLPLSQ